ncbi:MAG: UDP-4-amino-4,6-dideoxy-N-acetyl-beta-L-altrosamine transaminase [Candidatus Magasanikbacteria bacterium RIFOXYC12_FULL_33_11]|uniref:UDP-4-amino-4, 6-dideoxy-N-acetyl-beta-L-altrosamine transaminase n=1 Tax=Candidatus Magasanikbacteria bacterium RIFOXYC12_FULL_33_11 TaxID=1798701 RepID=A0A1F6NM06_9BACT|nr:MAG: UDP-4-amino-4,6-dideoxy-N-acetyl-beta-L-altrosamine transaminase [Candidatus Magasanikbacteria bacterium RIFOXYC12_FULL_33_11]
MKILNQSNNKENLSIPYGKQFINDDDIESVISVLKSDYLTQGPMVAKFEEKFAKYVGAKYAVVVSNGTAALHLSALALGVNDKSKVITTPITFAASANCIRYCGGEVVFSDINGSTATIDLIALRKLLQTSTKGTYQGIIPVDLAGYPINMEEVKKIADEFGLWIIEDACHSPGGYFTDSKGIKQFCGNGNYADLTVFSFHPVKHITTGEGGMITTNNEDLYKKLLLLRTHGITKDSNILTENHGGWYYEMQELGFNYRLPDILCALGISQLQRSDENIKKRKEIADTYDQVFENVEEIEIVSGNNKELLNNGISHAYHLYIIRTKKRKELYNYLREHNIFVQVHYIPLNIMPYYKTLGHKKGDMPVAEKYYEECLSLPMYPSLKKEEQKFVIEKILEFIKK